MVARGKGLLLRVKGSLYRLGPGRIFSYRRQYPMGGYTLALHCQL